VERLPPRTLLEQLVRYSRRTIEETCIDFEGTAAAHDEDATLSPRQLWRWMAGQVGNARPVAQRVAERHWGYCFERLIGQPVPGQPVLRAPSWPGSQLEAVGHGAASPALRHAPTDHAEYRPLLERVEQLRQGVHDVIGAGALTEASLDDWERQALRYGRATRYRPVGELLTELAADLAELRRELERHQTSTGLRRLTRVTAQMAGLMFLTLIKLNVPGPARNWARTARVAADESDDPRIRSWVRAQEAYVHYYAGDLNEAIEVAVYAQALAHGKACVGVPLAAALEARAHAVCGRQRDTEEALGRAEAALDRLDAEATAPSAFSYNEAQLRFHEGNAYTHLRAPRPAVLAQQRALELYPQDDYLDRTLVRLDRAGCLAWDGDAAGAMAEATQTVLELTPAQRNGMIVLRGQEILDSLPTKQQALPVAREFHDLLMHPPDDEGTEP
jgi:hypothetical protein